MSYHFLETLLNVDSPAARSERPYEFPDFCVAGPVRDRHRGPRRRRACASTTTISRLNSNRISTRSRLAPRSSSPSPAGSGASPVFELHNDLRVTKVLDEKNQPLSAERVTQDSTVRVPLPAGLSKDASTTLTFEYEGQLPNPGEQQSGARS